MRPVPSLSGFRSRCAVYLSLAASVSGAAVLVFPAVMLSAGMPMLMTVVAAAHIRIVCEISCQISVHRIICTAGYAAEKLNASLRQRHLRSAANPAAD